MNPQRSTYLSVVNNQWSTFTKHSFNHSIEELRTCRLAKQLPGISQLKKKYPQIDVEVIPTHIKPLKNGIYVGQVDSQERPQGYGMIKYSDRSIVEAQFKDGKANGKGFKWFGQDWYYVGDFWQNSFDGRGIFVSPDLSYEGQFKNNTFHGQGQLILTRNNSKFMGTMENGEMIEGKLTWETTSKINERLRFEYNGTFSNNQFHGDNCTLENNSGIYRGSFREGKKEGQGRFQFLEKYQYIGEYHNNVKSGFGTLFNPQIKMVDGRQVCELSEDEKNISYQGNFQNNLPNGKGRVYKDSQNILVAAQYVEGIWTKALEKVID